MSTAGPILHVIPFLWSGAGSVVTRLCESQRQRRRRVVVVTTGASEEMSDWPAYRRRLKRAGVDHRRIDLFHRDAATFWTGVDQLTALLRSLRPSVVHAHAGVPAASAAIARDSSGYRTRLIGQMYSWGPSRPDWMNTQDLSGFARCDRVVCSARAYQRILLDAGLSPRRLLYLPWGLPLEELPLRTSSSVGRSTSTVGPVLGFIGRIEQRKGQVALVETLARVRKRFPGTRLDLVGPIADQAYGRTVSATVEALGLTDAVTLHDRVPRILPFLERWDAFVSLSSDEGQGLAVLEAMAVGVPVVARRVAGLEDFLVHGRTGRTVRGSSPRNAAHAVIQSLTGGASTQRIVAAARKLAERRYSWARTERAFIRLYAGRG